MSNTPQDISERIYTGSVAYGKMSAKLDAFSSTIFGLLIIIFGIYMIVKGFKEDKKKEQKKDEKKDEKDKKDDSDFPYKKFGIFLLVIGALIIGGAWLWVWLTSKYETASQMQTVSDMSDMFTTNKSSDPSLLKSLGQLGDLTLKILRPNY